MARIEFTKKRELTEAEKNLVRYVSDYAGGTASYYGPYFEQAAEVARTVIVEQSEAKFIAASIERVGKGYAYNHLTICGMMVDLLN